MQLLFTLVFDMFRILFAVTILLPNILAAQQVLIKGVIKDAHSDDAIAFASVQFVKTGRGKGADTAGAFLLYYNLTNGDTLRVTSVGYADKLIPLPTKKIAATDTIALVILMDRAKAKEGIQVKSKITKGILMWRRIVKHKPQNDRYNYQSMSYNLYNKMELDVVNLNKDKIKDIKLLKPFGFVLENIDSTSDIKPFLPLFLTETFSNYYLQNNPRKTKEIITASRTSGFDNESVSKLLGGMYQNINIYNNFIPVLNVDFVSPLSSNGDSYYKYRVVDTQMIANHRCFHLTFTPKKDGENTFVGDCWVADTTFAIQKIYLTLDKTANINYIEKLTMVQEYAPISDSTWFITKEKFIVTVAPVGKNKLTVIGRKTTNYTNILLNNPSTPTILKNNKTKEDIVINKDALKKDGLFWQNQRPELLSKNEQSIYNLVDTLNSLPIFKTYSKAINFITSGTRYIGNLEIGPWYNWISANQVEGTRLRFDLATNEGFNKKLRLHGYLAYGMLDKVWKYKLEALWLVNKDPRQWFYAGFTHDYDNGQRYYDEVSTDNVFTLAMRKPNVPVKFLYIKQTSLEYFKEFTSGLSIHTGVLQKVYEPIRNLPAKENFTTQKPQFQVLNNVETFVKFRYAFLERFVENHFFRTSLGSPYPITELRLSRGLQGILGSAYTYTKVNINVSDYIKTPPYGSFYYNVFAGKVFGNLPFMLLETHPGNEIFYYNKYAFNMMNRFEYISDEYAGINMEQNIGSGIFKYIPITRKLKLRQFFNAKLLWGSLSNNNTVINILPNSNFKTLNGKTYIELGTGIDNILKVLRLDFVWRVDPTPLTVNRLQRFAVFGSFKVGF